MNTNQLKRNPTKKIILVAIGIAAVIGLISSIASPKISADTVRRVLSMTTETANTTQWKTLVTVTGGRQMQQSPVFHVFGTSQRLHYTLNDDGKVASIYLVPAGKTYLESGELLADTSVTGSTTFTQPAGDYYLEVVGTGSWSVRMEETR